MTVSAEDPDCPSEDALAGYVAGQLASVEGDALESHLDACSTCRRTVSALAAASHVDLAAVSVATAGTQLGRFTLIRPLGAGAMGDVWAARDPELDREVAIKLLRVSSSRLRREAQAMARIRHPNVVSVYELGADGDRAFCAMELVDGITLREWCVTRRPWRAVLDVAVSVGRGLAAAHAAGLIHRDVKPENVLIARDGRTLVTDFGLAKLGDDEGAGGELERARAAIAATDDARTADLTRSGALIGTPAYMAPEQLERGLVDARSDQFSYCVTIYEALFGVRPFNATNLGALFDSIRSGPPNRPEVRDVPRRVLRALERGLAVDPAARWPSVDALVAELLRATRRRRGGIALAIGVVGIAAVATVFVLTRKHEPSADDVRAAGERRIEQAWNSARKKDLHAAFVAAGDGTAAERAASVDKVLDKYRADWLLQRQDAWAATHERGEQTLALLERRLACFDRLADELGDLVTLLAKPAAGEVKRAPDIVQRLQPIANCSNARRLTAESLAPSTPAGQAAALTLRQLEAMQLLGRHDEVLRRAETLVAETEAIDDPMLHARARYNFGVALENAGKYVEAEKVLRLAVQDAASARDHYMVASAWLRLVSLVGLELGRPEAAAELEPAARAAVAQAGDDPRQVAELSFTLGLVAYGRGDLARARDLIRDARDRRIVLHGADHPMVASMESNLAAMLMGLGELDEATRVLDHARAVTLAKLGEKHPLMAQIEVNRAGVAARRKDWPTAEAALQAALTANLAVRGPSHPETAQVRANLARALREQRRFPEARDQIAQARIGLAKAAPTMPQLIELDMGIARIAKDEGKWAEAETFAKRAIEAYATSTAQVASRAAAISELAEIVAHRSPRESLPFFDQALALHLSQASPDRSMDAEFLEHFATAALAARRPDAALVWFDKMPEAAAKLADLRKRLERGH